MLAEEHLKRQERKIIAIVLVVAVCGSLGIDIHLASLPHIMAYMQTDKASMQQSISIYLFGMGGSILFYGPLSDKYGRRPIVIFGLSLGIIASFASDFTRNIDFFLLTRLLQGIGIGVCGGLVRAIFADILPGARYILLGSYLSMITSLGPLFAPTIGGYIQAWLGWQANFVLLAVLLSFALLLYGLYCPETNLNKNPQACSFTGLYTNYKSLVTHSVFVVCTILSGIGMAAAMAYATLSSFIFQTGFHLSPVAYGWITTIAGLGNFAGKFVNSILIRRIGSKRTIAVGLSLMLIAGLWLTVFELLDFVRVTLIIVAVFVTMSCQTFIMINASAFAVTPFPSKRGSASALYGCFQMLTAFFSSAIVGAINLNGTIILTGSYCILSIIGLGLYYSILNKKSGANPYPET